MEFLMNGDYESRINDVLFELIKIRKWVNKNQQDTFTKYLTSYAVIKACARIEVLIKEIIYEILTKNGSAYAQNFVNHHVIDSPDNPSTHKIARFLDAFSGEMKKQFEEKLKKSDNIKSDLNSLVNLRNAFAHGRDMTSSIDTIIKYYLSAVEVIILLQEVLGVHGVINRKNILSKDLNTELEERNEV